MESGYTEDPGKIIKITEKTFKNNFWRTKDENNMVKIDYLQRPRENGASEKVSGSIDREN